MKIGGPIPLHIAKAYDVAPKPPPAEPVARVTHVRNNDSQPASGKLNSLVAARVNKPIDFDAAPPRAVSDRQVLQLYTRAADKVEAAVNVELGRTIDLQA